MTKIKRTRTDGRVEREERMDGVHAHGSLSGSVSIDLDLAKKHRITLDGNITSFTLTNGIKGCTYTIVFRQDGTGSRTLAGLASNIKNPGGVAPTLTTAANASDQVYVECVQTDYWFTSFEKDFK